MCESETHEGTSFMNILNIKEGQHYIAKIESHSFVDGEGVRCSVYVSGCPFQCKGCYNVQAQNFKYLVENHFVICLSHSNSLKLLDNDSVIQKQFGCGLAFYLNI